MNRSSLFMLYTYTAVCADIEQSKGMTHNAAHKICYFTQVYSICINSLKLFQFNFYFN